MATINLTANGKDQELILAYLTENASEVLADKINNGVPHEKDGKQLVNKKDLNGFMKFACDEARKQAAKGSNSACVEDSVVYGWAMHYFEEDSIVGKLYNQDGTEYKPPAPVKKTATKPTTPTPTPPKPKSQFSFFDMLDGKKPEANVEQSETKPEIAVEQKSVEHEPVITDAEITTTETKPVTPTPTPAIEAPQKQTPIKPKNELYEKYLTYVNRHPDSVVAIRVGDFYEVFGKRAVEIADELGLTLTGRDLGLEQRIPMVGIPYHAAETYFKKLRQRHTVIVVENDGERKLDEFGIEDVLDGDCELTESEMRLFDGDIQEPKDVPKPVAVKEQPKTETAVLDDNPYDEEALAKVVKLFGNNFILR